MNPGLARPVCLYAVTEFTLTQIWQLSNELAQFDTADSKSAFRTTKFEFLLCKKHVYIHVHVLLHVHVCLADMKR